MRSSRANLLLVLSAFLLVFTACDSSLNSTQQSIEGNDTVEQQETAAHTPLKANINKALAEVRSATAKYQDVRKAEADGYVQFSPHVPGMGIHYLHESVINNDGSSALDNNLDRKNPEIMVYVEDEAKSKQRRLVAAEYAVPKESESESPPANALELFPGLEGHDWHVHPSSKEFPPKVMPNTWTIHGECHYEGGVGIFLAEDQNGDFVLWTPTTGAFESESWSGTVNPNACPSSLGGDPLPSLLIAHGKWWTLHAWVWYPNPEGVFNPTNPRVNP